MTFSFRQLLRRISWIYHLRRSGLMAWRRWRYGLKQVDRTFYMVGGSFVSGDLVAKEYAFINTGCWVCPRVTMGRYVMLGPGVTIIGADHRLDVPGRPMIFAGRPEMPQTVLEDDVWIGANATILAGVRIGRGAVIAAGAVVTKDVPPYEIHAGVPAKKIRDRFADPQHRQLHDAMLDGPVCHGTFCEPIRQNDDPVM